MTKISQKQSGPPFQTPVCVTTTGLGKSYYPNSPVFNFGGKTLTEAIKCPFLKNSKVIYEFSFKIPAGDILYV